MKIASWNVNSVRARLDHVEDYLRSAAPDVLCLQETKVTDAEFPLESFSRLGYETARVGQKTYNGVALLSKHPIEDVRIGLSPKEPADEARLISGRIQGVRVLSAYIPNGKNLDSPSFKQKLEWLGRLRTTLSELSSSDQAIALCGDFNIAKDHRDVFDPEMMAGKIHFSPLEHQALAAIEDLGLVDSLRQVTEEAKIFSWWDYRMSAFGRNRGLRIDYIFVSKSVAQGLTSAQVDKTTRSWDKPSDHAPCVVEFSLAN